MLVAVLSDAQAEVLVLIYRETRRDILGRAPTYRRLGSILGKSKSNVQELVQRLEDRGVITTEAWRNRSAQLTEEGVAQASRFLEYAAAQGHCTFCQPTRSISCPVCGLAPVSTRT